MRNAESLPFLYGKCNLIVKVNIYAEDIWDIGDDVGLVEKGWGVLFLFDELFQCGWFEFLDKAKVGVGDIEGELEEFDEVTVVAYGDLLENPDDLVDSVSFGGVARGEEMQFKEVGQVVLWADDLDRCMLVVEF